MTGGWDCDCVWTVAPVSVAAAASAAIRWWRRDPNSICVETIPWTARIRLQIAWSGGSMRRSFLIVAIVLTALTAQLPTLARQAQTQTPEQFFGFRMGTDGELARYPKIL